MSAARIIAATAAVAAAVLAGCSSAGAGREDTSTTPSPAATASSGPVVPNLDQHTPLPTDVIDEDTGETVVAQPVPTWDPATREAAVDAAEAALTAFARPNLDYDTWWAELEPLLTPRAAADYAYVDPANVPATTVTGPGQLVDDTSAYVAHVQVPTDVGPYTVVVLRADGAAPWLTSRITPPQD